MISPSKIETCRNIYKVADIKQYKNSHFKDVRLESIDHTIIDSIPIDACKQVKIGDNVRAYMKFYIMSDRYRLVNMRRVLKQGV
jgi:hypothetical protein